MHLKAYNYSQIEEHLPLMPTQLIGSIAALLTTYHEKEHSFLRAQELVRLLVNAYWTNVFSKQRRLQIHVVDLLQFVLSLFMGPTWGQSRTHVQGPYRHTFIS